jgi:hypothetical protein
MLFITSISPKHIIEGRQAECVETILQKGDLHSLNHPDEIEILKDLYPKVKFVPTYSTQKHLREKYKYYVRVNALFNHPLNIGYKGDVCIINSDIEIGEKFDTGKIATKTGQGLVYLHRHDYEENKERAQRYTMGIDAMCIHTEFIDCLPQVMHCLGQTYWDILFPYLFWKEGIKLFTVTEPYIYHKKHHIQYNSKDWEYWGKHTAQVVGRDNHRPAEISTWLYKLLETSTTII